GPAVVVSPGPSGPLSAGAGAELSVEAECFDGSAEQVALGAFAAHGPQGLELAAGFHDLGDHAEPQPMAEPDDAGDEAGVAVLAEPGGEGSVDLYFRDRQPVQ